MSLLVSLVKPKHCEVEPKIPGEACEKCLDRQAPRIDVELPLDETASSTYLSIHLFWQEVRRAVSAFRR